MIKQSVKASARAHGGRSWDLLILMVVSFAAVGGVVGQVVWADPGLGAGAGGVLAALVHVGMVAWSAPRLLPPR